MFDDENTEGFTAEQLEQMNLELAEELDCFEDGFIDYQEFYKYKSYEHRKPGVPPVTIGFYSHTITSAHIRMTDEDAVLKFLS